MSGETIPVILDTDIGNDIDDAVCLAYLLNQPRCELLGVTTVTGPVQERASLVDAVCRAAGRTDVPIRAGTGHGINLGPVQNNCPQAAVLPKYEHTPPGEFKPNEAVQFLREQIHARPGEITLLAVGPMTNLGLLFSVDPEIPALLKDLVLMCGIFTNRGTRGGPREWNALCDPIATAATYRAKTKRHLSVGLDVTTHCTRDAQACIKQFDDLGGALKVVASMTEVWASHRSAITFHDPLAATLLFKPELCTYEEGEVTVELQSDTVPGMTHWHKGGGEKSHTICATVDAPAFFEEYFGVFK